MTIKEYIEEREEIMLNSFNIPSGLEEFNHQTILGVLERVLKVLQESDGDDKLALCNKMKHTLDSLQK